MPPETSVNPAPEIVTELIVTVEVPVEVSVRNCVADVLTVTLPKAMLPGAAANCGFGAAVLVPVNVTTAVPPVDEVLLMVNCPVTAPVTVGLNRTCSDIVCPGLSVTGGLALTTAKPVPEIVAEFTVTGAVPVELKVSVCVVDVFTAT